jgi:hypothetical protein
MPLATSLPPGIYPCPDKLYKETAKAQRLNPHLIPTVLLQAWFKVYRYASLHQKFATDALMWLIFGQVRGFVGSWHTSFALCDLVMSTHWQALPHHPQVVHLSVLDAFPALGLSPVLMLTLPLSSTAQVLAFIGIFLIIFSEIRMVLVRTGRDHNQMKKQLFISTHTLPKLQLEIDSILSFLLLLQAVRAQDARKALAGDQRSANPAAEEREREEAAAGAERLHACITSIIIITTTTDNNNNKNNNNNQQQQQS